MPEAIGGASGGFDAKARLRKGASSEGQNSQPTGGNAGTGIDVARTRRGGRQCSSGG
jgi:hypothetical protein